MSGGADVLVYWTTVTKHLMWESLLYSPAEATGRLFLVIVGNIRYMHMEAKNLVFSSTVFLFLFLPFTVMVYYNPWLKSRRFRNYFLLAMSLAFYAYGEPLFVSIMLVEIVIGWLTGLKIEAAGEQKIRKRWLWAGGSLCVALLFVFKYLTFVSNQLGSLLSIDTHDINIALPIGISFFTFQLLSYMFDIYYGKARAQANVLNVGLYIALFPQLIAGPIVRYDVIAQQIQQRKENLHDFAEGMLRFSYGLGKKVLVANYMAMLADNIFNAGMPEYVATAWLGAIAYTLQIYFDFSGYSDMAIGLGRMFGFKFPENFNYPYIAGSVTDFWRRWHISLSSWFRDYVYIPLGGNRCSNGRWLGNLFVVWALTGIWHGANWTFLCWGLWYFVWLVAEKLTGMTARLGALAHIYTLLVIVVGWVLFRSDSIGDAVLYIQMMAGLGGGVLADEMFYKYLSGSYSVLILALALSMPLVPYLQRKFCAEAWGKNVESLLGLGIFLLSVLMCVSGSYNPFIYFNF